MLSRRFIAPGIPPGTQQDHRKSIVPKTLYQLPHDFMRTFNGSIEQSYHMTVKSSPYEKYQQVPKPRFLQNPVPNITATFYHMKPIFLNVSIVIFLNLR